MFFIPLYILILLFTIVIDYYAGAWIEQSKTKKQKKLMLTLSLIANIGILAVFKYYNFFIANINELYHILKLDIQLPVWQLILPIGLSFHTFQAMSYTIEIYRGNQKAEKHFGIYALYVMFYPQLVAGPIERPQNILHQFKIKHQFNYEEITKGLRQILWGLIKKVMIADRIAPIVNEVYGKSDQYHGFAIVMGTVFFAIQIYCDFSGYSDIAIGTARTMGFRLMKNFDTPYLSKSVSEFWRRWHISLSTWFRDYLYIPLGGNRTSKGRWYFNLLFVFLISGLWHGANWTYIVWGALLGIGLIVEATTKNFRSRIEERLHPIIYSLSAHILTISYVCFSWLFFRANSISHAMKLLKEIFSFGNNYFVLTQINLTGTAYLGQPIWKLIWCIVLIILLITVESIHKNINIINLINNQTTPVKWSIYYLIVISILLLGAFTTNEFIYFQF
jgi:alginate O-acetyltransferase complex protein AlgI